LLSIQTTLALSRNAPVFTSAIGDLRDFALAIACFVLLWATKAPPCLIVFLAAVGGVGMALIA
jgi:chromate transporter